MSTFTTLETFTVLQCWKCGISFGLTRDFESRRRNDHEAFYCVAGHAQFFSGKSEAEQLRDQIAAKDREVLAAKSRAEYWVQRTTEAQQETTRVVRQRNAYKGVTTRMKRKIGKGVCPCCSEKFKNVAAHMRTEHPNWNPDKEADAIAAKATA